MTIRQKVEDLRSRGFILNDDQAVAIVAAEIEEAIASPAVPPEIADFPTWPLNPVQGHISSSVHG